MGRERNHSVDILRFICAYLVVTLHVHTPYHSYTEPIARCAVPLFFMMSGYFGNGGGKKRILKILIVSSFVYALLDILFFGADLMDKSDFSLWKTIVAIVLFNENPFAYHLWYLSAYIYVLLLVPVIRRYGMWRMAYFASPLLIAVGIVFGKYSDLLFQREYYEFLTRNFLFVGLPFYLIGHFMGKHKNRISRHKEVFVLSVLVFLPLAIAEGLWVNKLFGGIYISTVFLSVSIFLFTLSCFVKREGMVSRIGRQYTLYIYITHLFWIKVLSLSMAGASGLWGGVYRMAGPLVIFVISFLAIQLTEVIRIIYKHS